MTNIICNECETVAHCMKNGCVPKQPAYRAVKTYHKGKPVYVAEQPAQQALNKMAENARELGLDYEPDIPFGDNNPGLPWDEVPQAFNDWWNADYDPTGNPFEKDTHAYWAWAGRKAAEQPAPATQLREQEPDAFVPREAIRTLSGGANHVPATLTLNDDGGKAVAVFLFPQPAQRKPLTIAEVEQILGQHNYEIHGDRARYIVRMTEAAHNIKENT